MRKSAAFEPQRQEAPPNSCHAGGCREAGLYRAPHGHGDGYDWYCLAHIREFNQRWNFFAGMEREEIERFMHDALTGHRPTWPRESAPLSGFADLDDSLAQFLNGGSAPSRPPLGTRERRALKALGLEERVDAETLKAQYRTLVKQYHPDLHFGSKEHEEKFKEILAAYHYLLEIYEPTPKRMD